MSPVFEDDDQDLSDMLSDSELESRSLEKVDSPPCALR